MRKLLSCCMVMASLSVAGPQKVAAQNGGGFGAAMEWISRLSGPQFAGGDASFFTPDLWSRTDPVTDATSRRFRVRIIRAYHRAAGPDDILDPDGSTITMSTWQPMLEIPLWPSHPTNWYVEAGIGYAWHEFGGDANEFHN